MSLINDALKRAGADKPRDVQSSGPGPMQPVEAAPSGGSPILLGGVLLLGVGAVGIAAALWFGGKSTREVAVAPIPPALIPSEVSSSTAASAVEPTVASQPIQNSATPALPTKAPEPNPEPNPVQNPVQQTAMRLQAVVARNDTGQPPVTTPTRTPVQSAPTTTKAPSAGTATSVAAAAPAINTESREPRLQSIFYRLRGPTVILNGKTLKVGDSVDGIKVMSIQRTSVEVMQNGKYRTLTLQH